ncbi:hypothetical protein DL240_10095 [Lujinxingia litoralis]|uniref:Glycosyl transferase family 51 domain-containing protein n=1 Tax=Lujinxingia litoralis TaxID=2211119 RepID=A0A328CAD0_9DELT|nr:biosynthetic peptidoglycan transglycosylase [Lujinxingia litoralis]RAL22197.1 hypothetical protein DL240_10095 [Lujinxingia litoralis]
MNRRTIIVGIIAATLIIAALFLPRLAAPLVERALPGTLERAGVHAHWSSLSLSWTGAIELDDLHVKLLDDTLSLDAARVRLHARPHSLLTARPELTAIQIQNAAVVASHPQRLRELLSTPRPGAPATTDASASADHDPGDPHQGAGRLEHLLKNLPDLTIDELHLSAGQGAQARSLRAFDIALLASGDTWEVEARSELPAPLNLLSASDTLHLHGTLSPGARDADLRIGQPDQPALRLRGPGGSEVIVGELRVQGAARQISLSEVSATLSRGPLKARAHLPLVRLSAGESAPLRAELDRPVVELLRPTDEDDAAPPASAQAAASSPGSDLVTHLKTLAWSTELEANHGAIFLPPAIERPEDGPQPLLQDATLRWEQGHLNAFADTERGRALAHIVLSPASLLPRYLRVHLEGVSLDALPGLTTERTLPRRGFRGEFGGEIDLFVEAIAGFGTLPDTLESRRPYALRAAVEVHHAWVDTEALANERLEGLDLSAHGTAELDLSRPSLRSDDARVSFRGVDARLKAELDLRPGSRTLRLDAASPGEIRCQSLLGAVPEALLGAVAHARVDGKVTPAINLVLSEELEKVRVRIRGFEDTPCRFTGLRVPYASRAKVHFNMDRAHIYPRRRTLVAQPPGESLPESIPPAQHQVVEDFLLFGPAPEAPAAAMPDFHRYLRDVGWLNGPFSKRVHEGVSPEATVRVGPGLSSYVPLDELPGYVGGAMFLSEDMRFYSNRALATGLLNRALRMNISRSRYVYGGSTLTQQLVKNLFLTRQKSLARKIQEVIIGWRIDEIVPKERVLELYLNVIEFGPDIYGIGPAARFYFDKDARELSPLEAIFLANLKPAPWEGPRLVRRGRTPEGGWWIERTAEIGQRLVDYNYLTPAQAAAMAPYVITWSQARMELERERYRAEKEAERRRAIELRRALQRQQR